MAQDQDEATATGPDNPARLRVRVIDHARGGKPSVDVSMPVGLVRFGLTMAKRFSPAIEDVPVDWDVISTMIEAGERGPLVHVQDDARGQTVDVSLE